MCALCVAFFCFGVSGYLGVCVWGGGIGTATEVQGFGCAGQHAHHVVGLGEELQLLVMPEGHVSQPMLIPLGWGAAEGCHPHPEAVLGKLGGHLCDVPKPDESNRLSRHRVHHELRRTASLVSGLRAAVCGAGRQGGTLGGVAVDAGHLVPFAGLAVGLATWDLLVEVQHRRQRVLGQRGRERPSAIAERDLLGQQLRPDRRGQCIDAGEKAVAPPQVGQVRPDGLQRVDRPRWDEHLRQVSCAVSINANVGGYIVQQQQQQQAPQAPLTSASACASSGAFSGARNASMSLATTNSKAGSPVGMAASAGLSGGETTATTSFFAPPSPAAVAMRSAGLVPLSREDGRRAGRGLSCGCSTPPASRAARLAEVPSRALIGSISPSLVAAPGPCVRRLHLYFKSSCISKFQPIPAPS